MYGNIRKPMLKSAMAAENKTEPEQPGEGTGGMPIFCWSFQSDFTNEIGKVIKPDEPEATDILSCAS